MKIIFDASEAQAMMELAQSIAVVVKELKPELKEDKFMEDLMGMPSCNEDGTITLEYHPTICIALTKSIQLVLTKIAPFIKPTVILLSGLGKDLSEIWKEVNPEVLVNGVDQAKARFERDNVIIPLAGCGDSEGKRCFIKVSKEHRLSEAFAELTTPVMLHEHEYGFYIIPEEGFEWIEAFKMGDGSGVSMLDDEAPFGKRYPIIYCENDQIDDFRRLVIKDGKIVLSVTGVY